MKRRTLAIPVLLLCAPARGEPPAPPEPPRGPSSDGPEAAPRRDAAQAIRDGALLPLTTAARVGDAHLVATALGGWDGAPGRGATFSGAVEGLLYRRVAVRAGFEYGGPAGVPAASIGLRVGLLRQERHGVDLGIAATYRSVGFTEDKGVVEVSLSIGRRFDRLGLFANAAYGQGFASDARHGEVRAAALYSLGDRLALGLDSRCRFDLGSVVAADSPIGPEVDLDLLAGPLASYALGPVALIAQAGLHALAFERLPPAAGFAGLAGVGASF